MKKPRGRKSRDTVSLSASDFHSPEFRVFLVYEIPYMDWYKTENQFSSPYIKIFHTVYLFLQIFTRIAYTVQCTV
jgi:hypothetical protein